MDLNELIFEISKAKKFGGVTDLLFKGNLKTIFIFLYII